MISVEYQTKFEFAANFSIMVYSLNWFWFVLDLVWYLHQKIALDLHIETNAICK